MTDNIVIIGGGVIGAACAYFISTHPAYKSSGRKIVLLEATELAGGASGKAGGLVAMWAFPSCIVPLSFRLHAELAQKFNGEERWGYRVLDGCSNVVGEAIQENGAFKKSQKSQVPEGLEWVDGLNNLVFELMAAKGETAQVHPRLLTVALVEEACKNGVEVIYGKATDIVHESSSEGYRISGIKYITSDNSAQVNLSATSVIVTAGPWTPSLLPKAPISTVRAHSVVIKPSTPIPAHVLFTNISLKAPNSRRNILATPEIYPRPDGTVYACGEGDSLIDLPLTSADVAVDQKRIDLVLEHVGAASTALRDGEVVARQACYLPTVDRPVSGSSGPLIGLTSTKGLLVATGHTCWGISNSVGTGCLVSEILWEGKAKSADIDELDPRRWDL